MCLSGSHDKEGGTGGKAETHTHIHKPERKETGRREPGKRAGQGRNRHSARLSSSSQIGTELR